VVIIIAKEKDIMAEVKWLTNGLVDSTETKEFPTEAQQDANPVLTTPVDPVNPMKEWLVGYVGDILKPTDGNVTTEMIVHAFGVEFPELMLAIAEENWMRGYSQALHDSEKGYELLKDGMIELAETPPPADNVEVTSGITSNDTEAG
jgi:hypothetical protein